jgi:molybdate transport system ATP-binding protein
VSDNLLDINIRHSLHTARGTLPMEVSIQVPGKNILAVTGPSGAGKTTLLKQIAGLIPAQSGKITFGSEIWLDASVKKQLPVQKRNIGFVFQDYALFPHMTVRENLLFALPEKKYIQLADELLETIDLVQLASRKPFQLSGGQQQRVALARALVRKPDLLLLDEPLSALDFTMRKDLQDMLLHFHRRFQFTMIIVTHDVAEIFRVADRVAVMEDGKIVQTGTPSEIFLRDSGNNNDLILYGEVLTSEILNNAISVRALIQGKIRELSLPLHLAQELVPGATFAFRYALDSADIQIIDANRRS